MFNRVIKKEKIYDKKLRTHKIYYSKFLWLSEVSFAANMDRTGQDLKLLHCTLILGAPEIWCETGVVMKH